MLERHARATNWIGIGGRLAAIFLLAVAAAANAQTNRYITDNLKLESRTGPGVEHRIVKLLESGTRVSVVEERNGWSRITLPGVDEAWILSRYLLNEPAARSQLEAAVSKMEAAQKAAAELKAQLAEVRGGQKSLQQERDKIDARAKSLDAELTTLKRTAASAVEIRDENERLTQQTEKLTKELAKVQGDYNLLRDGRERDWFVAGAGVLLGGMILGLVIPALVGRRRRRWGEL